MKTSKKIILTGASLIFILLIISLLVLRNDLQFLLKSKLTKTYKTVSVKHFEKLDFSANWIVKIVQGKEYKVELALEKDTSLQAKLENKGNTLYFKVELTDKKENLKSLEARITVPSLKLIKGVKGTKIYMENFQSDSLKIILENGGTFTGISNYFKHLSFKTSGDALLDFKGDIW